MTTSDCWVIWDNRLGMLEVTTKECHGLHRYDCVLLEGGYKFTKLIETNHDTASIVGFNSRPMRFMINQHSVQVKGNRCVFEHHREYEALRG